VSGSYTAPVWNWLITNSAAVQAVASAVSGLLSLAAIVVLLITWGAIKRQAKAAEDQTKAATDAAEAARKQGELLSAQLEQSTAPLLVVEPDDRQGYKNYKVLNRGPGVAFQIFYWQGELELALDPARKGNPITPVRPSTLGPGSFIYLPIPPAWTVFTIRYKGADREERWTVVHRDGTEDQHHWVRKLGQVISLT